MLNNIHRKIRIGLMGASIESGNMGCLALTYSLLKILNEIEKEEDLNFDYYFFDGTPNTEIYDKVAKLLKIEKEKLHNAHMGFWVPEKPLKFLRCIKSNTLLLKNLLQCDCIIDITGGDSFTDIYGMERFWQRTHVKNMCGVFDKPLLLAPQTYGPFLSAEAKKLAKKALQLADVVMARDELSQEVVKELSDVDTIVTTDLAFQLPYSKKFLPKEDNKIKIGLNFSGLLAKEHVEQTDINFVLKTNYDLYMDEIAKYVADHDYQYEVYLLPHVREDNVVHKKYKIKYPQFKIVENFDNPIQAKNVISTMDVFVGARMHGTIAAFTTGVACVPTAYSRKFKGLFNSVGYQAVVDLQESDTQQAVNDTINYICNYKILQEKVQQCNQRWHERGNEIKKVIKAWISVQYK